MQTRQRNLVLLTVLITVLLLPMGSAWAQESQPAETVPEPAGAQEMATDSVPKAAETALEGMGDIKSTMQDQQSTGEVGPEPLEGLQPLPETLPELFQIATRHNPELLKAQAELAQAQANLRQVQMKVVQEIATLDQMRRLNAAPGNKEHCETKMRYLLGIGFPIPLEPSMGLVPEVRQEDIVLVASARPGPEKIPPKIAEQLTCEVSIDFGEATPIEDILCFLSDYTEVDFVTELELPQIRIALRIEDAPLSEVLTALTDQCEPLAFVVRDYGILATTKERARGIAAPAFPTDLPLLQTRESSASVGVRPGLDAISNAAIEEALRSPVSFEGENIPLTEVIQFMADYSGINFARDTGALWPGTGTVRFVDIPLSQGLAAVADAYEGVAFVMRDYGILATSIERAKRINAPSIPEDIPLLPPRL